MNHTDKQRLISKLEERFGSSDPLSPRAHSDGRQGPSALPVSPAGPVRGASAQTVSSAFERMVDVGAARFGVRVDEPALNGFSACTLAPPLARLIDHTALKAETTEAQIRVLCEEARRYCFASVCVNPCYVELASSFLKGTQVAVCTVLGFPLGASRSTSKAFEAQQAIRDGASELDMVLNVGLLKSARYDLAEADIAGVVAEARRVPEKRIIVKVILETALLTDEEKVIACVLARNARADFVKTSTGFSTGGATAADVALMRRVVGTAMGVKASGGVRSREDAEEMIAHGATRIGASASVAIVENSAPISSSQSGGDRY